MSTANANVTPGDFISSVRKYSNKDKEGRLFNISADVNVSKNEVTSFSNGLLSKANEPATGSANFNSGDSWMSFNANNLSDAELPQAFSEVLDFMKDVKKSVNSQISES